jgi:acetylornithine/succinyldiaminopimelate/putrescine aminotransferase
MLTAAGWEVGLWAFFAGYDRSVLQFKPGILLRSEDCDEVLGLLEEAITRCEQRLGRA